MQSSRNFSCGCLAFLLLSPLVGRAETALQILSSYETLARGLMVGFASSPERGRQFFVTRHGGEWSCSSCHTENPAVVGKHVVTGKTIQPMAVSVNPERFSRAEKVEKWFGRNCKDVVGRACTPAEKADMVAYLLAAK